VPALQKALTMKMEYSERSSPAEGIAALAIVTAMIDGMPIGEQRKLLNRTQALLGNGDRVLHKEATQIIRAMLVQLAP
jgi:hypothetical protein